MAEKAGVTAVSADPWRTFSRASGYSSENTIRIIAPWPRPRPAGRPPPRRLRPQAAGRPPRWRRAPRARHRRQRDVDRRAFGDQAVAGGQHQPGCGGIRPTHRPVADLPDERKRQCTGSGHDCGEKGRRDDDPQGGVHGAPTELRWAFGVPIAIPAQAAWAGRSVGRSLGGGAVVCRAPCLGKGAPGVGKAGLEFVPAGAGSGFEGAEALT